MPLFDATAMTHLEATTAVWVALVAIGGVFIYRSLHPKALRGIPIGFPEGVHQLPWLVGLAPALKRALQEPGGFLAFFNHSAPRHAPIWQLPIGPSGTWLSRWTGFGENLVVCTDSHEIEDACTRRANIFVKGRADVDGAKVATPTGQIALLAGLKHRHHRRVFGPSMTGAYLAKMTPRIEACVDELVSLWKARSARAAKQGGQAVDVGDDLIVCTTDVGTSLTFGKSFGGIHDIREHLKTIPVDAPPDSRPPAPRLTDCFDILQRQMAQTLLTGPLTPLYLFYHAYLSKTTREARQDLVKMVTTRIAEERAVRTATGLNDERPSSRDADHVLGMVLDEEVAEKTKGHEPLPHNELCDELVVFVGAGADTSAALLKWTVKYLARHPEVQRRLRAELVERLPAALQPVESNTGDASIFQGLNDEGLLPYTTATAYECARLAHVASLIRRTTVQDTTVLGHFVPAGTGVMFLTGWAQAVATESQVRHNTEQAIREGKTVDDGYRKSRYWGDDVAEFRPERWLKEGPDGTLEFDRLAGPWLPFGAGARGCFGKNLAMLIFKVFLVKLSGAFFFERVPAALDGDDWNVDVLIRRPSQAYVRLTSLEAPSVLH